MWCTNRNRARNDKINKGVILKNCAPFNDCINEVNNTQIDNAICLICLMPMFSLIQYDNNYSKTSGSLWKYSKDKPHGAIVNSESFKYMVKITGKTPVDGNTMTL